MKIRNVNKQTEVAADFKLAESFLDRNLGLLRKSNPRSLVFKTRFGIHTFGLKNLIDVIVLNHRFQVIKTKKYLAPNRLFFWNPRYAIIIELPPGMIENSKTEVGDTLLIKS